MPGYRLIVWLLVLVVALVVSACGMLPGSQPSAPTPTAPAAAAPATAASPAPAKPAAAAASVSPSPAAKPTSTSEAAAATTSATVDRVWVGNTDGEGVYIRKTPAMADRIKAYPDKTVLVIIGPDVDGDGQKWHQVRAPDDVEGYVPVQYTVTTEP
jgi:hypothetical protein